MGLFIHQRYIMFLFYARHSFSYQGQKALKINTMSAVCNVEEKNHLRNPHIVWAIYICLLEITIYQTNERVHFNIKYN